ncbi:MAG TPA: hypothetical protein VLT61_14925 [Anaeromyxobacteraceae bacterium]|nr:hypothetical protein [Anaeromyxobacteraceae bacterium]
MKRIAVWLLICTALFAAGVAEAERAARIPTPDGEGEAVQAVRRLLVMLSHYEEGGRDPRFLERLPVTAALAAEIAGAAQWEGHLDEQTEVESIRSDVLSAAPERGGAVRVRTREYAVARVRQRTGGDVTKRILVGGWEYRVVRTFGEWRVVDWAPVAERDAVGAR